MLENQKQEWKTGHAISSRICSELERHDSSGRVEFRLASDFSFFEVPTDYQPYIRFNAQPTSDWIQTHTNVFIHMYMCSRFHSLIFWYSITGASVRENARPQDTSCHVLIQLSWNSKYPCLFVLVELHIHHNYVNYSSHSAFYKQLRCGLDASGGRRDQCN